MTRTTPSEVNHMPVRRKPDVVVLVDEQPKREWQVIKGFDGSSIPFPLRRPIKSRILHFLEDDFPAGGHASERPTRKRKPFRVPNESEQYELLSVGVGRARGRRLHAALADCSHRQAHHLMAMNPWAGNRWANCIATACEKLAPESPAFFVTLFDHHFDLPVQSIDVKELPTFLADRLPVLGGLVRSRMKGLDFVLEMDLALHRLPRQHELFLCPHFHGLVFGSVKSVGTALARFGDGLAGADGGQKTRVYYLPGALRYICKDTRCRYVTVPPRPASNDKTFHYREAMSSTQRMLLLEICHEWAKPELCLGSGVGSKILAAATRMATERGYVRYEGVRPRADCQLQP